MANIAGSAGAQDTNVVTTPVIENVTIALAATEQSHVLPSNTKRFTLKNRGAGLLKLSYAAGTSGTLYYTVEPGTTYDEAEIRIPTLTFYIQSSKAGDILEIISWS